MNPVGEGKNFHTRALSPDQEWEDFITDLGAGRFNSVRLLGAGGMGAAFVFRSAEDFGERALKVSLAPDTGPTSAELRQAGGFFRGGNFVTCVSGAV